MFSNRLAFIVLGGACMAAAAGGGYLAMRQNTLPAPAAAAPWAATAAPSSAPEHGATDRPVERVQEPKALVSSAPQKVVTPARAKAKANTTQQGNDRPPTAPSVTNAADTTSTSPAPQSAAPIVSTTPSPTPAAIDSSLPTPIARPEPRAAQEPVRVPEPQATFEELVVSANSVIGLTTETRLSSETAKVEDRVEARVTRDVRVGDRVAIPAGSRAIGTVTVVDRGGKFKERARLGIRFLTLVLPDGTRLPMSTETIYRDGEAPGNSSAQKVGAGAVGGAILGAILGGAKGAAIGATAGAGGGAAVVAAGDRSAATLPAGTPMTVRILSPLSITIEK
jgi:hypothetical protein